MSDDAQDALDLAAINVGGHGGTEGAEDATQNDQSQGVADSGHLTTFGSVDVSNLQEETVQALSGLDPETRAAFEAIINKEATELRRVSNKKMMEAADIRKQAEAVMSRAQYADMIDQLMKNGAQAPGQAEAPTTVPLTEIDYDSPDAEDKMAARLAEKLGIKTMFDDLKEMMNQSVNQNPQIKKQALMDAAGNYWASLESNGTALTLEQRQVVAKIWDSHNPDPLAVDPSNLPRQLQPIVDAVLMAGKSFGTQNTTEVRKPSVANPLPPSGTSSSSTQRMPVWQREGRKPHNPMEVLRDSSDGTTLEQLEKALADEMGKR